MANLAANADVSSDITEHLRELMALRSEKTEDVDLINEKIRKIQNILGEAEAIATLRAIRWPKGIVCPRCGSTNIKRRDQEAEKELCDITEEEDSDFKQFYQCIDCSNLSGKSVFSDFTGLPDTAHPIIQWAVCWYVLGLCSPMAAAQKLGLGFDFLLQVAMSQDMELLPIHERLDAVEQVAFQRRRKETTKDKVNKEKEETELRHSEKEYGGLFKTRPTRWK